MRIGITGGSGLIGGALICALEARGDTVIRFVRPDSSSNSNEAVRWDPSRDLVDEGDLRRVAGFDAVVHLAGAGIADKRWSSQRKQEIMTTHDHVLKNQTLATIIPSISILSLSFLFSSNVHSLTSFPSFLLYVRLIYIFIVFSHSSYFSSSL